MHVILTLSVTRWMAGIYKDILTSKSQRTCECFLTWKKSLQNDSMKAQEVSWPPCIVWWISATGNTLLTVPHRQTHRGKGDMKREAEIRVVWPQPGNTREATGSWKIQDARSGFSLITPRGDHPCWFLTSNLQNCEGRSLETSDDVSLQTKETHTPSLLGACFWARNLRELSK